MIGEWLGKLKTALNPPLPPDFLLDDELDELEEELPALAKVIRAQQDQIKWLIPRVTGRRRTVAAMMASLVVLVAWMFRYEPMPMPQHGAYSNAVLLDRWTGNILIRHSGLFVWVDVQSASTESKDYVDE